MGFLLIGMLALSCPSLTADDKPQIVVQLGQPGTVESIAVSPDGAFLLTCAGDTADIWNVMSGKQMRSLRGHSSEIRSVAFSPDSRLVLTGSADKTLKLWDAATGRELRTFAGHGNFVDSVAFSPDGRRALSSSWDTTLKLWDIQTGAEIRTFSGHRGGVYCACFSPDGTRALSGSIDGTMRLWDVETGYEIGTFEGHNGGVRSVAFSPDGRFAISGSDDSTIIVWDVATCGLLAQSSRLPEQVRSVAISPDGSRALSAGTASSFSLSSDGSHAVTGGAALRLWDLTGGAATRSFDCRTISVNAIAFSPDGRRAFAGTDNGQVILWDLDSRIVEREFTARCMAVNQAVFTPDGRFVLTGSNDNTLKVWDLRYARRGAVLYGHTSFVESVAFSPDGTMAVSGSADTTLKLWNVREGREIRKLAGHPHRNVDSVAFSPDGRSVLSGGYDGAVRLWDAATGAEIRTISGSDPSNWVRSVAFSPDGATVLSGSDDGTLRLWDTATGRQLRTFTGHTVTGEHTATVFSVAFSPDGRHALSGSDDGTLKLWDIASGREEKTFVGHKRSVWCVAFSPDGSRVLSGSSDKTLILWDVASGRPLRVYRGHTDAVRSVAFSPDGRFALSSSSDTTVRMWNLDTGRWTAFLAGPDGSQWLIFTDDGYWDGSPNGGDLVAMVRGMECWNIDQFAARNNRPDIILERIGCTDADLIAYYRAQYLKRLRRLGLTEEQLSEDLQVPTARIVDVQQAGKSVTIRFALRDDAHPLKTYSLFVNDVPLFGAQRKAVSRTGAEIVERVELTGGDNKIEVSCMNDKGAESWRVPLLVRYAGGTGGNLYYIGFGVSTYRDASLDLSYAHKDALDLADAFSRMGGAFGRVHTFTFVNEEVTPAAIANARSLLKDAKPDDTLVVFIAGHGVHDSDPGATYYYLTYGTDLGNLAGTAANFDLVEEILQGVAPRNKLFLMDTCESGEIEEDVQVQYYAMAVGRGIKARATPTSAGQGGTAPRPYLLEKDRYIYNDLLRRSGTIVFSSCRGDEFSYEEDSIRNGLFTKSVIDAFSGRNADTDGDGIVSTDELRAYVSAAVPRLTSDTTNPDGYQHPTVDRDNIYQKFGFPVLGVFDDSGRH